MVVCFGLWEPWHGDACALRGSRESVVVAVSKKMKKKKLKEVIGAIVVVGVADCVWVALVVGLLVYGIAMCCLGT